MDKKPIYTLTEIAEWANKKLVSLPTVQRGFVWRPFQIENLWDSLLRGYPIGAFVLSPKDNNGSFELLDGQQRGTAICLGFGNDTFRDSQDKIRVFIDLDKPKGEDNRKYIFRVITQSHPWGYRKIDNTKILTSENIRKAMLLYEVDDHLEASLDRFFPFDASLPLPFDLFIKSSLKDEKIEQLMLKVNSWPNWKKIKKQWDEKVEAIRDDIASDPKSNKVLPELSSDEKITRRISEIYDAVKIMLDPENGQKIPALYLNFEKFTAEIQSVPEVEPDQDELDEENDFPDITDENDRAADEIENLFIRLNAGGTPLRGEELNYSILKANITLELQNEIEEACKGFSKPSRFITIAYRLYQQNQNQENRDALTMRIKPKQFQKTVSTNLRDFEGFLQNLLSEKSFNGKTLIEHAKHLLEYEENKNTYGLPYLITSKISDAAPEVMFMYLYRIWIWKDTFKFDSDLHRKMIGMISLFLWLGKGEKQRDHAKLLSNIWPCAKTLKKELFWSSSTIQRAMLDDILTPFPTFDLKSDKSSLIQLRKYHPQSNRDTREKYDKETKYGLFVDKMFYNRGLILYAQRNFLYKVFKEKQYLLDDTNVPFDWDHISPHKFVHRKFRIPFIIKQWYNTNGNLRAWPYSLNRMDQDDIPALKLNPLNPELYSKKESVVFNEVKLKWERYIMKNKHLIQNKNELKKCLLEWSFCENSWTKCKVRIMKTDWREVYPLILERNLSICQEWYKELCIEDLIPPESENFSFSSIFDLRKWDLNPEYEIDSTKVFKDEGFRSWVSKPLSIGESNVHLYLIYNSNPIEAIQEVGIEFGIFEEDSGDFIKNLEFPDKSKLNYGSDRKNWIQSHFTLISHEEESYVEIIKEFKEWLKKFPKKEIKNLAEPFIDSLVSKYKIRFSEE